MNLTKKRHQELVCHPISENFTGTKFLGKKRWSNSNFPRRGSSTTTTSDTTNGNGKVAGTAALPGSYAVFWYLVFIRKVFELHANATTRRNGHAEDEEGCSSLPRIRVFLLLFLPSFHHSRGYSLYCFAKETGAWNARVKLLWHTFPRIN